MLNNSFGGTLDLVDILEMGLGLIVLVIGVQVLRACFVYIPNTGYGIVERKWSARRRAGEFGFMALEGGAGFLPEVIRGGWHVFPPFQYRVHKRKLITIDQIAYLIARVGASIGEGQALGRWPEGVSAEDARGFLDDGGQRGQQRHILRSGTYAIHTALFCVITDTAVHTIEAEVSSDDIQVQETLRAREGFDPIVVRDDTIGIVTVQDGPALQHGEIIAPTVGTDAEASREFHNSFQDIGKFLNAGGRRGRQEQVLVDGTYFINRLFATVEIKPKTQIAVGTVGVINSYVGPDSDVGPGDGGRGRTVEPGRRGIWSKPLQPGKHPLNPYACELIPVPVTNFQLRWMDGSTGSASMPVGMTYDADLKEIPVITRDAFEILMPLSIVAHISAANAPYVIQHFSHIQRLVNQTLDPFVSSYFKDVAQRHMLLDFIQKRSEIGAAALDTMKGRLREHRIDIEEVMLGTPKPAPGDTRMETMLEQLRLRQIASEQEATYAAQELAATKLRALNEEQARADQQSEVTRSRLAIQIAENEGEAETARQTKAAAGIRATADADSYAATIRAQAFGGPENLLRRLVIETLGEVIREAKVPLVPATLVTSGAGNEAGGLLGLLTAMALKPPVASEAPARAIVPRS